MLYTGCMAKALKVVRVSKHAAGRRITVEAKRGTSVILDSFLGEREFYLDKGDRLTLLVKGRDWYEGDKVSLSNIIWSAWNWSNVPWQWN